jgi:site-specific recombinase XerD
MRITHKRKTAYISFGFSIAPYQWDEERERVVGHPNEKLYNKLIEVKQADALRVTTDLKISREINNVTAVDIKCMIEGKEAKKKKPVGQFVSTFETCIKNKVKQNTVTSYTLTLKLMRMFDPELDEKTFDDINLMYLQEFDNWLRDERKQKQTSRNVNFRNIRSVFNTAIDNEITDAYPFRKFKLKREQTRKRSLTVDQLRTLRDYPCDDYLIIYRDMFMLMFYLCGINAVDLFCAPVNAIRNGRLEYTRAKTGKNYSIKVEPEAMKLIKKYKGKAYLLSIQDKEPYKHFLEKMSKRLKDIGPYERKGYGGKKTIRSLFPDISQYWCRHTWATIAAELDIPKETIAAGLGHDMGNTTTAIYINFNQKKVDAANRKIIDFVNKKSASGMPFDKNNIG